MSADHARASRTAATIKAQVHPRATAIKLPADELILGLAEAYLELANSPRQQIYVTTAAAREYAQAAGLDGIEEARRELTELLLEARPKSGDPSRWRLRERNLDARVVLDLDGRLAVITHVHVRDRDTRRR